ncbi:MAG: RluA family pseudouridine synthase [Planctomycetota bacterium]|jgi:RluA family pseudouridine synthase
MAEPHRSDRRVARVPARCAGQRLDQFLVDHFPRYSRRQLSGVIRHDAVLVNERRARPGTRLAAGDRLDLPVLSEAVARLERAVSAKGVRRRKAAPPVDVEVLYRDDVLLVVSKPPGVPVHAGARLSDVRTLIDLLRDDILMDFGLVHRLDRDTSGAIALVRGAALRASVQARFADPEGGVEKTYEAIVEGVPDPPAGEIDLPLAPPGHGGKARVDETRGKPARTRYATVETFPGAARLRLELCTGRTHQIRAHLAAIGHPLLVDPVYGARGGWKMKDPRGELDARLRRTPLHAAELTLPHPVTEEIITVRARLPGDMKYALEVLRVDAGRRRRRSGEDG